jgi:hypothetical protein
LASEWIGQPRVVQDCHSDWLVHRRFHPACSETNSPIESACNIPAGQSRISMDAYTSSEFLLKISNFFSGRVYHGSQSDLIKGTWTESAATMGQLWRLGFTVSTIATAVCLRMDI